MMPRFLIAASCLVLSGAFALAQPRRLSDFRQVVIPDAPQAVQKAAAEELAAYASRISGQKLPILPASKYDAKAAGPSFFLGSAAAKACLALDLGAWKEEEYLLRSVPEGLVLAGDDSDGDAWSGVTRAGTMLAVFTLLDDHLGCRWFWPGPFGEHVPAKPDAMVPALDVRAVPKLMIRSIGSGYSAYHTARFREDDRKWHRRNRLAWTRSAIFGHSWYDAFHLKTDDSFEAHPDWFALVKGKHQPPQMCTTHPEVLDRMVEHVLKGKSVIMHISPSDGGGFCQCNEQTKSAMHKQGNIPSCTSLDVPGLLSYDGKSPQLSDRIFTYANEIARRVREKNPAKGVGMFAYTYYNRPPRNIAKMEPNLYLSFVYQAFAFRDPAARAEWEQSVAGWKKLGAQLVMREGWGNHYALDLPWPHVDQILQSFARAYQLGFIAAYGEGSKAFATQAPNVWAITRMMWNPERDTTTLMEDYYREAYGPAAAEMQAFFETYNEALNQNWSKRHRLLDTTGLAYANLTSSWHLIYPREVVEKAEKHLKAAEAKASAGEYGDRVAFHRHGQKYTATMLEMLDCYRQLEEMGVRVGFVSAVKDRPLGVAARDKLLKRAFELGEERERLLLAHRDWAALDEGLLAFANDRGLRDWHGVVKKLLKIDKAPSVTKARLDALK